MAQETPEKKLENDLAENKKNKQSSSGTISVICGILGLVLPFILFLGGIVLSLPLALVAIITGSMSLSTGKGKTGLILGILTILLLIAFIIPSSSFFQQDRLKEIRMKEQMYKLQLSLEDFKNLREDTLYPVSMLETADSGKTYGSFIEILRDQENFTNAWTDKPTNVELIKTLPATPLTGNDTILAKGDIRIYCNGYKYLITGGGKNNTVMTLKLMSGNYDLP